MKNATDNTTRAVSFFDFHGMTMLVAENGGKRYVEAKPLSDLVGLNWRTTRPTITSGDNLILYGICRLIPPAFNVLGSARAPLDHVSGVPEQGSETEIASENGVLHILFERIHMFLARISTSQMRVQGNVTAANYLLSLQIEWAQVLHKYEMGDVVSKKSLADDANLVMNLMKARAIAKPREALAYDTMIANAFAAMGYELPDDPQKSLPLQS
jgi:hypothetical protein